MESYNQLPIWLRWVLYVPAIIISTIGIMLVYSFSIKYYDLRNWWGIDISLFIDSCVKISVPCIIVMMGYELAPNYKKECGIIICTLVSVFNFWLISNVISNPYQYDVANVWSWLVMFLIIVFPIGILIGLIKTKKE